jgi:histidinol-phosphate aminotransferase
MSEILAPQALPSILEIAPYVGGESKTPGGGPAIKLSSNEGAFGPSPAAIAALQAGALEAHRYPDGHCQALRQALADYHGIPAAQIVCGAGSDELITLLVRAYCAPGEEILYSQHGFLMYAINAQAVGARARAVPEQGLKTDAKAMRAAIGEKTKLVFVANPNNPTGSYLTTQELQELHQGLPPHILLVIDAAYSEYVDRNDYTAGIELVQRHHNVVMLRTFSKLYGLGGLRVGWAYGPPAIVEVLNRLRNPFNVSSLAQSAAIAALHDYSHQARQRAHNDQELPRFSAALRALGLHVYQSVGNFVLVDFSTPERAEAARLFLQQQGIIVRQMSAYGLGRCLRITIGRAEEMASCEAALGLWLALSNPKATFQDSAPNGSPVGALVNG